MLMRFRALTLLLPLIGILLLAGCDQPPDEVMTEDTEIMPTVEPVRIISLAPALTQMLIDLGEKAAIVGVAENDNVAPADIPKVGNFLDIDSEAVIRLRPTVVVMMTGKDGVPPRLRELADKEKFDLLSYPSPNNTSEVANILYREEVIPTTQPDEPSLGYHFQITETAQNVKYKLLMDLAKLSDFTSGVEPKPRVLALISTTELGGSGPHTILDELIKRAGGINVLKDEKLGYVTLDREMVLGLKPDVILIVSPGASALGSIDTDSRLSNLKGLDVPAVTHGRIHLINDPAAMLPSTTIGRVSVAIAKAIHPELAAQIDHAMAANAATAPSEKQPHHDVTRPAP